MTEWSYEKCTKYISVYTHIYAVCTYVCVFFTVVKNEMFTHILTAVLSRYLFQHRKKIVENQVLNKLNKYCLCT